MPAAGECVFCGSSPRAFRVLKCLHIGCNACVGRNVQHNNTVTCPACRTVIASPGHGRSLLSTLPSCQTTDAASKEEAAVFCDDCSEDVGATHVCLDCQTSFCGEHAVAHPERRKSRGHRVERRKSSSAQSQQSQRRAFQEKCPLHLDQLLEHFCRRCQDVCCAVCLSTGAHADHTQRLQSVVEAAEAARADIVRVCSGGTGDCQGKLKKRLEDLERKKDEIKGQGRNVSKEISTSFRKLVDSLKEREEQLLLEADRLCWEELEPLEEDTLKLSEQASLLPSLQERSEQCVSDCDVVRLGPWLQDKAREIIQTTEEAVKSGRPCDIVCRELESKLLKTEIGRLGSVTNRAAVDPQKSSFEVPNKVWADSAFDIRVKLCTSRGEEVHAPLCYENVEVAVSPSWEILAACADRKCVSLSKSSLKVWSCKVDIAGQYTVDVRHGDFFGIKGSPCTVKALSPLGFDRSYCAEGLALSENCLKVTCPGLGQQLSVYSKPLHSGVHSCTLRFHEPKNKYGGFPLCGIISASRRPLIGDMTGNYHFIGFSSNQRAFNGQATEFHSFGTVARWTSNALFKLIIDCDKKIFTMECCQHTGDFSTCWMDIPVPVCIRVGLFYPGSSFEILQQ